MKDWIFKKLSEKSTWIAIVTWVVGTIGVAMKPELQDAIVGVGLAVTSLALATVDEKK